MDHFEVVPECASDVLGSAPSPSCAAFLAANERAREQWRHEAALREFESLW